MAVWEVAYNVILLFRITNEDASAKYIALTTIKLLITLGLIVATWFLKERMLPFVGPLVMLHKFISFVFVLQSEAEEGADENFDRKMYAISGYTHVLIVLCFLTMRPKVDLFVTIPMAYIVAYVFLKRGYSEDEGNMACFTNPQDFFSSSLQKIYLHLFLVFVFWFVLKRNKVNAFLQKCRAE